MKKADVEMHSDGYRDAHPAVNVKHHLWLPDLFREYEGTGQHEFSDDAGFWAWLHEIDDRSDWEVMDGADEIAREVCWEDATEIAHDIWPEWSSESYDEKAFFPDFPPGCQWRFTGKKAYRKRYHVQVYSEGRSGGWCVVHGLPDVEDWDAIALGRWARFEKAVKRIAFEEYPYQFIWHLNVNVWEHIRAERESQYPTPNYAGV